MSGSRTAAGENRRNKGTADERRKRGIPTWRRGLQAAASGASFHERAIGQSERAAEAGEDDGGGSRQGALGDRNRPRRRQGHQDQHRRGALEASRKKGTCQSRS